MIWACSKYERFGNLSYFVSVLSPLRSLGWCLFDYLNFLVWSTYSPDFRGAKLYHWDSA